MNIKCSKVLKMSLTAYTNQEWDEIVKNSKISGFFFGGHAFKKVPYRTERVILSHDKETECFVEEVKHERTSTL